MIYVRYIKRILDFCFALLLIILTLPIMLLTVILIKLDSKGPVIFTQERPGKDCAIFTIYKFRTMFVKTATDRVQGNDMYRITRIGRILRKTSIDELPQLFNILTGSMSFIGPRPLMVKYLDCYTPEQMRRHEVLPGISGYAQVKGRSALSWNQKFEFDVWYVDHISFFVDFKIFVMTFINVLSAKNTEAEEDNPCTDFVVYLQTQKNTEKQNNVQA